MAFVEKIIEFSPSYATMSQFLHCYPIALQMVAQNACVKKNITSLFETKEKKRGKSERTSRSEQWKWSKVEIKEECRGFQ